MNQVNELKSIELLLDSEQAAEAQKAFARLKPDNSLAYFLIKGKIEQKFQNWGEAINAFNNVLKIDPNNTEARNNLQIIQNILNFWNPEMFNP